uniref:Uncharacterized protein n=1 Tax=Ditylenchus dipsaci TaxID=166011 RepID=A0A915DB80_9BILA
MLGLLFQISILVLSLTNFISASIWIGEEYWTTVHYDGSIESSRSISDFLHFPASGAGQEQQQSFVAYWMSTNETSTPDGSYEAFGHAFPSKNPDDPEICARFKDSDEKNPFAFVKSSLANEERAVEYLDVQISRISPAEARDESGQPVFPGQPPFFGGAKLRDRTAYGVHSDGSVVQVSYKAKPASYVQMVEILEMKSGALEIGVEEWKPQEPQNGRNTRATRRRRCSDGRQQAADLPSQQILEQQQERLEEAETTLLLPTTTLKPITTSTTSTTTTSTTTPTPSTTTSTPSRSTIQVVYVQPTTPPSTTTTTLALPTTTTVLWVNGGGFVFRKPTTTSEPSLTTLDLAEPEELLPVHHEEDTEAQQDEEWVQRLLLRRKKRLQQVRKMIKKRL